jgi:benzoyl-CoA reductase/2-hydroxyglutaryl-CoA dehydratase subunit BcrC/BadD/HgdB
MEGSTTGLAGHNMRRQLMKSTAKTIQEKPDALKSIEGVRDRSLAVLFEAEKKAIKVIGIYCTYCPRELVLAAGLIPIGLCGTRETPITAAEKDLPRNLCPLIKSSYGFAIMDTCPFFHAADMVIGETTCDGKKKMFEVLKSKGIKEVYVMNLPQMPDEEGSLELWLTELRKLRKYLENRYDLKITDAKLRKAIHVVNERTRAEKELLDLNKNRPALISGMDMLTVSWQTGFGTDTEENTRLVRQLTAEIKEKAAKGYVVGNSATKRILLTGTPVGLGSEKVMKIVEESGALVVAMENCGGYKTVEILAEENEREDPLSSMAKKYMKIPCSVMTPNKSRLDLLKRMIKDFQIDGVIDLDWQACHTYNVESFFVAELVRNEMELPFLQLETDYSQSDLETLRVRIEAFLETVKAGVA